MTATPLCLHCERAPQSQDPRRHKLRLCDRCGASASLRRVYRRPIRWTAAWDAHLQRLVERAKLGLPLDVDEPGYVRPCPPDERKQRRYRPPRVHRISRRDLRRPK